MSLTLVSAPEDYPVSVDELRDHLRLDGSDLDEHAQLLIAAETRYAERFTGRRFVPQTWDYALDAFPAEGELQTIKLPLSSVISVGGVYYADSNGADQTMDAGLYVTDLASGRIGLLQSGTWPQTTDQIGAVRIRFTAGDVDTSQSPATVAVREDVKLAIMLRVQASFDGGDQAKALREAADGYLKPHRVELSLG